MQPELTNNKAGDKAGKQENQDPQYDPGSIVNDPIDDDFGNRYLLGRQVAHEYHSSAVQTLIQHNATIDNGLMQAPYGDPDVMPLITASGNTGGNASGDLGEAFPTAQAKRDALKIGQYEQRKRSGASDDAPLQDPLLDPTLAAFAGAGAGGKLSLSAGMKLMPSLGRALTAGVVSGVAEYPIGAATEGLGVVAPGAELPFNLLVGMVSGVTLERAIEKSVIRLSGATGDAAAKLTQKIIAELESGQVKSVVGKKIKDEIDGLPEFFGGDEAKIPADWKQIAKELFASQEGAIYIERSKKAQPGIPATDQKLGAAARGVLDKSTGAGITQKYDKTNINLTKLLKEDDYGQLRIVAGFSDQFELEYDAARRGSVKWAEMDADANRHSLDEILGRKLGQAYNDQELRKAKKLVVASSMNLKNIKAKIDAGEATDIDKANFLNGIQLHYAIQAQYTAAKTETARAFRSLAMKADADEAHIDEVRALVNNGQSKWTAEELSEAMTGYDNIFQINAFVQNAKRATTIDMLFEGWCAGLLSGPPTHIVNITSNALFAGGFLTSERLVAEGLSRIRGGGVAPGEAAALAWGMARGARRGLSIFSKISGLEGIGDIAHGRFREGVPKVVRGGEIDDTTEKIETRTRRAITASNVQQLPVIKKLSPNMLEQGGMMAAGVDLLGDMVRTSFRYLSAEDAFFKAVAREGERSALALRKAHQESGMKYIIDESGDVIQRVKNDVKTSDIYSTYGDKVSIHDAVAYKTNQILDNIEDYPEIERGADEFALYATFQKKLGKTGEHFSAAFASYPMLRFLVPFMKTPTNLMKAGIERSPLAIITRSFREEMAAGGARKELAIAKLGVGTMVMSVTGGLATQGLITGGGPSDRKDQASLRDAGWQPYSINTTRARRVVAGGENKLLKGDEFVSFSRLEPMGMLLGVSADFVEISGLAGEDMRPEVEELGAAILASVSKNAASKTWLRGPADAIEAFQDPDRYMERWINGYVGTLVPTGVAQIERAANPEMEAVYGAIDKLKSRIIGLSADMPKIRNKWGEIRNAVPTDRSWPEVVGTAINPFYHSEYDADPIDQELIRLGSPISKPRRLNSFDGVAYEMSPQEYDDFIVNMNTVRLQTIRKNLKDTLNYMVTRDVDYRAQSDDLKVASIRRKFNEAKKLALEKTRKKHPVMDQVIEKVRLQKMREMIR